MTRNLSSTKRILVFSDVHLFHKKTSTTSIIDNLRREINSRLLTESIDVVFIAGDLFDTLVHLNDLQLMVLYNWIYSVMDICVQKKIALRVLEGTPSHDWKQSKIFEHLLSIAPFKDQLDYAYHQDLTIEYIKKLQMHVLYIPDEYGITSAYTFQQVQKKLQEHHLEKVDLVVMHGLFDFQVPHLPNLPAMKAVHKAADYLSICRHYVFVGHNHIHSHFDRILVEGSFDRLVHGEEAPKGFIIAQLEKDPKQDAFFFIENKQAKVYYSIEVETRSIEKFKKQLRKTLSTLPKDSHIRFVIKKDHPLYSALDKVAQDYLDYHFTKKTIDSSVKTKTAIEKFTHSGVSLNAQTLQKVLSERLIAKVQDLSVQEKVLQILREIC